MREISRLEAAPQPLRIIDAETTTAEQMMLRAVFRGSAFRECRPVIFGDTSAMNASSHRTVTLRRISRNLTNNVRDGTSEKEIQRISSRND